MRVALVAHGLPPHQRGGVESHTAALARELARAGALVEVFVPRVFAGLTPLAQRREERHPGEHGYAVTAVNVGAVDDPAEDGERRLAEAFGAFLDRERPDVVHFEHLSVLGADAIQEAQRRGIPTIFVAHDWWAVHDDTRLVLPDLTTFEPGDLEAEARGRLAARWLATQRATHSEGERAGGLESAGAGIHTELDEATSARLAAFLHPAGSVPSGAAPYGAAGSAPYGAAPYGAAGSAPSGAAPYGAARMTARGARTEPPALDAELELVRARQAAKRLALSLVDARFATSRTLARRLSALVGRAFSFRAPGIDRERIAAAARPPRIDGRFRLGFLGSVTKERGLHVLLEALEGLAASSEPADAAKPIELHVHGDSSDRVYVARCRQRAEALGAVWHGAYTPEELPQHLAALDAVCLPSLWSDSAPFVLREAYAAGLPVVVSDTEALRESVLPTVGEEARAQESRGAGGHDTRPLGLLVTPGDAGALRAALRRLVQDDTLRASLVSAVRRVDGPLAKRLGQEASEWLATYTQLVAAAQRRRAPAQVPAHLAGFARRLAALEELPTRLLFQEVTQGLVQLGAAVGLDVSAADLMTLAVGRGSRLRDERAADARAIEWLRSSLTELGDARRQLEAETRWRDEQLRLLTERVASFEQSLGEREAELARLRAERDREQMSLRAERDDHGAQRGALEGERERLHVAIAAREREQGELTAQLEQARGALRSLVEERDWLRDTLDRGTRELRWLREHVAGDTEDALTDREALELHFERLRSEHESLQSHEAWLRREVGAMLRELADPGGCADHGNRAKTGNRANTGTGSADLAGERALEQALVDGRARLARLVGELTWRRREMDAARAAAAGLFARVAGGELALRARGWTGAAGREGAAHEHVPFELPAAPDHIVQPAPRGLAPRTATPARPAPSTDTGRAPSSPERAGSREERP
jgi:glycosyltransferase involved in cell wall biosynthesis